MTRWVGSGDRTELSVGREPGVGITVAFRQYLRAVHVGHGAHFRNARLTAVNGRVNGQEMFERELVRPLHNKRLAAADFEGWAGPGVVISPESGGGKIAMNLLAERADVNGDRGSGLRRTYHGRDG